MPADLVCCLKALKQKSDILMRRAYYFTQPRHGRPNIEVEVGIVGELDGSDSETRVTRLEVRLWKWKLIVGSTHELIC